MTSIIQWNINSFYKKLHDIQYTITKSNPTILCLQETNLKKNQPANLKSYTSYHRTRNDAGRASGGVSIFVKNSIQSKQINISSKYEAIAISIETNINLNVCNIYIPDSVELNEFDLTNLIKQLPKPFILLGDFNSRNHIWGSHTTDTRGKILEKIVDKENLIVINNGDPTRININTGSFTAIDLTLACPSLAPLLEWKVDTNVCSSDHWPILIKMRNRNDNQNTTVSTKWNLRNPDWKFFQDLFINKLKDVHFNDDIDPLVNEITDLITSTALTSLGQIFYSGKRKSVPWWNNQCESAIKKYKKALNKYKKTKTVTNLIELKKTRAQSRYITKQSKLNSWKTFTESLKKNCHPSIIWNKIRALKGHRFSTIPDILWENDKKLASTSEKVNALAIVFKKNNSDDNLASQSIINKQNLKTVSNSAININTLNSHPLNTVFKIEELRQALKNKTSKSPGPDNIPFSFLINLPTEGLHILLKMYNQMWLEGKFPLKWLNALITPIPKPHKNKFEIQNYRPISLINTMSKTIEKMVNSRLIWYLETNNLLSRYQFGFRKYRSTIDALACIHTEVTESFANKQHLSLIAMDIEKAYDMIWSKRILTLLEAWGIQGRILKFIKNFIENRTFQVKIGNTLSCPQTTDNGLPQGSSLSVTLFLIAINDLPNIIQKPAQISLFADDANIYCRGKNPKLTEKILQKTLDNLHTWSQTNGFKFSPSKTKHIFFSKNQMTLKPEYTLDNTIVPITDTIKILGLQFDHKLTWKKHLYEIKAIAKQKLNLIKIISNHKWGADLNIIINSYRSMVRSTLDYGDVIYNSANSSTIQMINPIHNTGMKLALGAYWTSPTVSILRETGEPSLETRRTFNIIKYCVNKSNQITNPVHTNIFNPSQPNLFQNKNKNHPIWFKYKLICNQLGLPDFSLPIIPHQTSPPWTQPPPLTYNQVPNNVHIFLRQAKDKCLDKWRLHWASLENNKLREITDNISPYRFPPEFNRHNQTIISRARIGHTQLTHSYLMNREPKPLCQTCNVTLSIKHIIIDCPEHSSARNQHDIPNTLKDALEEINVHKIITFLKCIKLYELM